MSTATLMLIGIALALFGLMFLLEVYGYGRGRAAATAANRDAGDGLGVVEGAVFALLGLMLAFLFGGAAGRLGDRRDAAIRESNAIGTAYLRLDLLPATDADRLRGLFRNYLEARVRAIELKLDAETADRAVREAERLQQAMWSDVVAGVKTLADHEVELLLLPALNEMFDVATERNTIAQTHAALPVQGFLVFLSLVAAVLAGYSMSKSPQPPRMHMLLFAAVISTTIYFIFDMEYPRLGFIRIGAADRPLIELLESMQQ